MDRSDSDSSSTRRAWVITGQGAPSDVLSLRTIPIPTKLRPGDVLIRVHAAALNPVGHKLMRLLPSIVTSRPCIAEYDFSGVVADANDTSWNVGEEIFGWNLMWQRTKEGALAEYITVPADHIIRKPTNISFIQAAGVALVGLTAYQALFRVAKLQPGQSIFINGGSTAVGTYAIQMAKNIGATVVVSASERTKQYVKDMGADDVVDYTQKDFPSAIAARFPSRFDIFLEAVGLCDPTLYKYSPSYLKPQGKFISVLPTVEGWYSCVELAHLASLLVRPGWMGVDRAWTTVAVTNVREDLMKVQSMVASGEIKPVVDSVHSFENVLSAYARVQSGRAQGKVVVDVRGNQ